jgi:hypothetical protein
MLGVFADKSPEIMTRAVMYGYSTADHGKAPFRREEDGMGTTGWA